MLLTIGLIQPWNLAYPEISHAPETQALGEPCASIVIRPENTTLGDSGSLISVLFVFLLEHRKVFAGFRLKL